MISFDEYYKFLKKQAILSNYYYEEFENAAKAAKYMRNNRVVRKNQKDLERKKATSFNILNSIFKEEQKKKGVTAIVKVETEKDNKLKLFLKKIFRIKPPVVAGIIEEFSETTDTSVEVPNKSEVDSEAFVIETEDIEEEFDDEDFDDDFEDDWEEETEDFFDDDRIEGQMDIEELNEGDVYEEKKEN